jgi:hypothetical protein
MLVMGHGPSSHEKKQIKAQRLMHLLNVFYVKNDKGHHKIHIPALSLPPQMVIDPFPDAPNEKL